MSSNFNIFKSHLIYVSYYLFLVSRASKFTLCTYYTNRSLCTISVDAKCFRLFCKQCTCIDTLNLCCISAIWTNIHWLWVITVQLYLYFCIIIKQLINGLHSQSMISFAPTTIWSYINVNCSGLLKVLNISLNHQTWAYLLPEPLTIQRDNASINMSINKT